MNKEFTLNIILLVVINLIIKCVYLFFVEVEVQNNIGPSDYGIFLALFNLSYLFQFLNDPGIHTYNITSLKGDRDKLSVQLPEIFRLKLLLSLIFLVMVQVGGWLLGYDYHWRLILFWISFNLVLSTFYIYLRSNLSAIGLYRKDSLISALDKLLMIFIIGGALFYFGNDAFELEYFIWGQTISYLLSIGMVLILLRKFLRVDDFVGRIDFSLLKKSFPFAIVLLLMASYSKMDGVMLERLLGNGDYQAGIYAASLRFYDAANMFAYLFAALLLPMFASLHIHDEGLKSLVNIALRGILVLVALVLTVMLGFTSEIMQIYTAYNPQYDTLILWHMSAFVCVAISYVYGTLLTAKKKLQSFNIVLLTGVIINFILNFYLIPRQFASGAAIATFVTQLVVVIGQVCLAMRYFDLKFHFVLMVRAFIYFGMCIVGCYFIKIFINALWLSIVMTGIFVVLLSFLSGIIRKDMIFAVVKR